MTQSNDISQRPILIAGLLLFLAAVPISLIVLLGYGQISGSEFSPDDFSRRSFSYQKLPWLGWTISGIKYTNSTPVLEQTLLTDGLLQRSPNNGTPGKKTWHLYHDSHVPNSHDCDARFLTKYLDLTEYDFQTAVSTPVWTTWNEDHPQSAKIFWPTVADLARNEMYLQLPTIMRWALDVREDKPAEFARQLKTRARAAWLEMGQCDLQLGKLDRAAERLLRAQLIKDSDDAAKLVALCRNEVDDFDALQQAAEDANVRLVQEIEDSLSDEEAKAEDVAPKAEAANEAVTAEAVESGDPDSEESDGTPSP